MARRQRWTALAALAAALALPSQPTPAQDLFGLFWGEDAPVPRRPAGAYAISRPGAGVSGGTFFSPFGGLFSPFLPPPSEPEDRGVYRTLCVRMCDGYYFPISHATSLANFSRDAERCSAACGGDVRLFYHPSQGGDLETMQDLTGRTYASYPTAFKYRRTLVSGCQCRPQPWTEAELARHRAYAAAEKVVGPQPAATGGTEQAGAGGLADGSVEVVEGEAPPKVPPRSRSRPRGMQSQGVDWLFGGSGTGLKPKAPKSSYASSGSRWR